MKSVSNKIKWFYLFFTLGIVLFHGRFFHYNIEYINGFDQFLLDTYVKVCKEFGELSLAFFFFMSSFWFYRNLDSFSTSLKKIKKRFLTLIVPCFIWNFITIAATSNIHEFDFSLSHILYVNFTDPYNVALWTLLALFILELSSILIASLNRKNKTIVLSIVLLLLILNQFHIFGSFKFNTWWISSMISYSDFYVIGAIFSLNFSDYLLNRKYSETKYRFIGLALIILSIIFRKYLSLYKVLKHIYLLMFMIGLWLLFNEKYFEKQMPKLLDCNFIIYVSHIIVGGKLIPVFENLLSPYTICGYQTVLLSLFILIILIFICSATKFICKLIFKDKVYYLITGGR